MPALFALLCLGGAAAAHITPQYLLREMLVRFGRNAVLVLSLLVPILGGLGLNFGIVIGAIWNPTPYWNLELVFPRPKLARLINYGANHSDWVYVLGEFGGNSWAVQRDSGLQDKVTLRDLRVMLGIERRKNGGVNYRAEVGFVFAREIEYLSAPGANYEPADTVLLRIGTTF